MFDRVTFAEYSSMENVLDVDRIVGHSRQLLIRTIERTDELLSQISITCNALGSQLTSIRQATTSDVNNGRLLTALRVFELFISALRDNDQCHATNLFPCEISHEEPMSDENRECLLVNMAQLSKCIDPGGDLLTELVSSRVFDERDIILINAKYTFNEQAQTVVEILLRKANTAFEGFIRALRRTRQDHVIFILKGEGDQQPLAADFANLLRNKLYFLTNTMSPIVSNLLVTLESSGAFTDYDKQRVLAYNVEDEQNEMIIRLLLRKSQVAFNKFIDSLIRTDQQHIVSELGVSKVNGEVELAVSGNISERQRTLLEDRILSDLNLHNCTMDTTLRQDGIVKTTQKGSILVQFTCVGLIALNKLEELYRDGVIDTLISNVDYADAGVQSMRVVIPLFEFDRSRNILHNEKPMSEKHRAALRLIKFSPIPKLTIDSELFTAVPLCERQVGMVLSKQNGVEQLNELICIVLRRADSDYLRLVDTLRGLGILESVCSDRASGNFAELDSGTNSADVCAIEGVMSVKTNTNYEYPVDVMDKPDACEKRQYINVGCILLSVWVSHSGPLFARLSLTAPGSDERGTDEEKN